MAVSVRMDPLLEKELEQAARRLGVTKSQFIIDAVQRALGRKNPYELLVQIEEERAPYAVGPAPQGQRPASGQSTGDRVRAVLQAKHAAQLRDWAAYQEARKRGIAWAPDDDESAPQ